MTIGIYDTVYYHVIVGQYHPHFPTLTAIRIMIFWDLPEIKTYINKNKVLQIASRSVYYPLLKIQHLQNKLLRLSSSQEAGQMERPIVLIEMEVVAK